jgi:hypothetical protein
MSNIDDEIRAKTQAFANDLAVLVRRAALEAVATTLGASAPAKATRAAAPAPAAVKRGRGRPKKTTAAAPAKAPIAAKATSVAKAAPAAKPAAAKKAPKREPGAKRPPAELAKLVDRLGEYIKANPGQRMEAIAKALGEPTKDLTLPVKKLLAAKRIRSEGQKRATEYFAA